MITDATRGSATSDITTRDYRARTYRTGVSTKGTQYWSGRAVTLMTSCLVHSQSTSWWLYDPQYANTTLRAPADGRRARHVDQGRALRRRLHAAPLPDRAGEWSQRVHELHRAALGMQRAGRPQRHRRVQSRRPGCPGPPLIPPQDDPPGLRRGGGSGDQACQQRHRKT